MTGKFKGQLPITLGLLKTAAHPHGNGKRDLTMQLGLAHHPEEERPFALLASVAVLEKTWLPNLTGARGNYNQNGFRPTECKVFVLETKNLKSSRMFWNNNNGENLQCAQSHKALST